MKDCDSDDVNIKEIEKKQLAALCGNCPLTNNCYRKAPNKECFKKVEKYNKSIRKSEIINGETK